jgi:twitching motility protein PilJ
LGESSQQIGEIVKLIDDIADQTNMLALNAAIQAAMAGEQGKGFSVVTEEVRRLAQRSANATREIASLVKSIQDDTTAAVIAMEESTGEVVEGSKVADEAGKALSAIEQVVDELADLILNISAVSQQQATTSSSIAQSMVEISALTNEATNLRRKSSEVTALVARTADELRNSVAAFKVSSFAPALQAGNIYDHPPIVQDVFTPLPSAIVNQNNNLEISQPLPINNGHSQMPPVHSSIVKPGESEADLSSMLNENDDNLFDSMFEEVTTGRFYNTNQPAERENTKPRPQALG